MSDILIVGPGPAASTVPTNHNDLAALDAPGNHSTFTPLVDAEEAVKFTDADANTIAAVDSVNDRLDVVGLKVGTLAGLLKGTAGVVGAATEGTDYAPATSGTAILKGDDAGGFAAASAGTDYAPATSGTDLLKGNDAGGFAAASAGTDYEVPLTFSDGVTRSTNAVSNDLITGKAGGQTVKGGVAAGEDLTLVSTNHNDKGSVNIGGDGSTNTIEIEADGTLVRKGTATVWNDIIVQAGNLRPGSSAPAFSAYVDGIYAPAFEDGQADELHGCFEIPHDYKEGTALVAHVHVAPENADTGDVVLGFEYVALNDEEVPTSSTNTPIAPTAMSGDAKAPVRIDVATIPGTGRKIGDMIPFRLYRQNGGTDTFAGDLFVLSVGIHYESDTDGSRAITTK